MGIHPEVLGKLCLPVPSTPRHARYACAWRVAHVYPAVLTRDRLFTSGEAAASKDKEL